MPDVRTERDISTLRTYLKTLPEPGNSSGERADIAQVAKECGIPSTELIAFRDGNDAALSNSIVTMFNQILGRGQDLAGTLMDDSLGFADPSTGGWYGAMLAEESIRQARLRQYQLIDRTRPEAHSALDAWADLGVTGAVTDQWGGGFEPQVSAADRAKAKTLMAEISGWINGWILPEDEKVKVFRGMAKYGDQFGAIGVGVRDGKKCITKLEPRHVRTIACIRDEKGNIDPKRAWKQVLPGRMEPIAEFAEWELAQFANKVGWGDIYGEAIFEPCLRSYIQTEAMESAMIIRRLERAAMRYLYIVDVGGISGGDNEILNHIRKCRQLFKKQRTVDNTGQFRMQKIAAPPEEDIFWPKRDKDSPSDVRTLEGDGNIGQIDDFLHFLNKWLAGLGPPKSHIGYDSAGSKTGVNDLHIVFARKVRRMQLKFIHGLNHLYWVSLVLRGIDPRSIRWAIFPPALSTRDDLIRAQVVLAYSNTAFYLTRALSLTGQVPSVQWILKYIMRLDDEVIDDLKLVQAVQNSGIGMSTKNDPPQNAKEAQILPALVEANPFLDEEIEHLNFMVEEHRLSKRYPEYVKLMERKTYNSALSEGAVRQIMQANGVKELRTI